MMPIETAEVHGLKVTGEYIDKVFKKGRLVETIEGHNIVVNDFLILTMYLLKREQNFTGITYWAVGSGSSSWDDNNPPTPEITDRTLVNEIGRKEILASDIVFLDSNYDESSVPTNIIRIKATFTEADCNGDWREFGLFGGNASNTADSGIMIDKRNHTLLPKTSDMVVERNLRLTLQFS